ncbi:hypothetical protein AB0D78_15640 [Streptomyces avermitilis]|uniref:hypothetical protein n=1 Tax=Streptomyces avermitilis TaxID=33903 RepID=UPI0033D43584
MRTTTLGRKGPEVGVIGLERMVMTFSYATKAPRDDDTSRPALPAPEGGRY